MFIEIFHVEIFILSIKFQVLFKIMNKFKHIYSLSVSIRYLIRHLLTWNGNNTFKTLNTKIMFNYQLISMKYSVPSRFHITTEIDVYLIYIVAFIMIPTWSYEFVNSIWDLKDISYGIFILVLTVIVFNV